MILELKGIYKDYQQGKMSVPVLKDINFSMEEGEYVAINGTIRIRKNNTHEYYRMLDKPTEGKFFWMDRTFSTVQKMICQISDLIRSDLYFRVSTFFQDSLRLLT